MMSVALLLHMLAVVVWVGGMFFAYMALRPVATSVLEPPQRLTLWVGVFGRFFPWVWAAIVLILGTGLWMILSFYGGFAHVQIYVHLMFGLGVLMMLLFMHVFFAPYKKLKRAVAASDWPEGGKYLGQIRMIVGINTILGLLTTLIAAAGRYW